jgi:hypothetical protein
MVGPLGPPVEAVVAKEAIGVPIEFAHEVGHGFLDRFAESEQAELGQTSGDFASIRNDLRGEPVAGESILSEFLSDQKGALASAIAVDHLGVMTVDDFGHDL